MAHVTFDTSRDLSAWAWVPLKFPAGEWASAEAWAAQVGDALGGVEPQERARWRALAAAVAALPASGGGLVGRLWHVAPQHGTQIVAHLMLMPTDGSGAGELALAGLAAGGLQRQREIPHTSLAHAVESMAVGATTGGAELVVYRLAGLRAGWWVVLELVHPEAARVGLAEADARLLFDAIDIAS